MNASDAHDPNAGINTGGGASVSKDVHAGGDAYLGAKNVGGNEIHGNQIVYQYGDWRSLSSYTPPPLPALEANGLPSLVGPGPLPPGSRMTFSRNPLFTGREDDLRQLAALLLPYPEPVIPNTSLVTISTGIGGIGKTQLAVEFAHRYGRFFHGVHWVSMTNPAAVESEIVDCGLEMGLFPPGGVVDQATSIAAVRRAWSAPEPRLLIFDNCEDLELLAKWRPRSGGCRVLVTSRNTIWPPELDATRQPIALLPRHQSIALLREYLDPRGRKETDEVLGAVAAEVGDLPLALALAGHYLAHYRQENVTDYLTQLSHAADLLPVGRGAFSPTGHDLSVWRTFAVSYERLRPEADEIDSAAVALLARAACFVPGQPLPEFLLLATMDAVDPNTLQDALYRLLELGLLERADGRSPDSPITDAQDTDRLKLHRLIARFVETVEHSKAIGIEEAEGGLARAAVANAVAVTAERARQAGDLWAIRLWQAHLRYVTESSLDHPSRTTARLCNIFADWFRRGGDFASAMQYIDRALDIGEGLLNEDDEVLAESLNSKGVLLRKMGDLSAARPYLERALEIRERILGPDHPDTATSLNNLGMLLKEMGDLPAARSYYERALEINERILGPDHPNTATSLNNIGALLDSMGDPPAARPYYEHALEINERVLGPDHPDTAMSLNNMGYLLNSMGDLPATRPYFERALEIHERVLGPHHPDTAMSLNNLGMLLANEGKFDAAIPLVRQALGVYEKAFGVKHPRTRQARKNLASIEKKADNQRRTHSRLRHTKKNKGNRKKRRR